MSEEYKDLIIGVVDGYNWDKIKYWANSIERSGFSGHKSVIAFNMDDATVKKLTEEGFSIIGAAPYEDGKGFVYEGDPALMVNRFFFIYNFLKMIEESMHIGRVILTDVRDVVFQDNPTNWLDKYFLPNFDLILGSENLLYKDEPWGRNNMQKSFGEYFYDEMKDKEIFCAGVIAGDYGAIKDLCLNLWLICKGLQPHIEGGGGPDQAALNIMLGMGIYSYSTLFLNAKSGWVTHAGTSLPAIQNGSGGIGEAYLRDNSIPLPFIEDIAYSVKDGSVYVEDEKLTVLHQWDRVPEWKTLIEQKYGD